MCAKGEIDERLIKTKKKCGFCQYGSALLRIAAKEMTG
jgi:hypothetical protein